MENLVEGYDLLMWSELHDYLMEYLLINDKGVEFIAEADDHAEKLKLQFKNVKNITVTGEVCARCGAKHGKTFEGVSIMDGIDIEELDDNTLKVEIGTSYGIEVYVISEKLIVTKI